MLLIVVILECTATNETFNKWLLFTQLYMRLIDPLLLMKRNSGHD